MLKFLKSFIYLISLTPLSLFCSPFVTARLMGQFGNQLFIMAAAISLALDHGANYTFPDLHSTHLDRQLPFNFRQVFYRINDFQPDIPIQFFYREPSFSYTPIPYHPNMMMVGWFQSEKYFAHHKQDIINLFSPSSDILNYLSSTYLDILEHPKTVSVHMRSYLKESAAISAMYAFIDAKYIIKAMNLFPDDSLFVVFSNDMAWCKQQLVGIDKHIRFIEGEPHYHDFYLMSLCKDNIICNSTFSWWAAYLNPNPNKRVIAPSQWFSDSYIRDTKDLIPQNWLVID